MSHVAPSRKRFWLGSRCHMSFQPSFLLSMRSQFPTVPVQRMRQIRRISVPLPILCNFRHNPLPLWCGSLVPAVSVFNHLERTFSTPKPQMVLCMFSVHNGSLTGSCNSDYYYRFESKTLYHPAWAGAAHTKSAPSRRIASWIPD